MIDNKLTLYCIMLKNGHMFGHFSTLCNKGLKEIDIKSCTYYYLDNLINICDLDF